MSVIHNTQRKTVSKGYVARSLRKLMRDKTESELSTSDKHVRDLMRFGALSKARKAELSAELSKVNILTPGERNAKTAKRPDGFECVNYILHLTPSDFSGYNVCPKASAGCRAACLNGAGRGQYDKTQTGRLRRTLYFIKLRDQFIQHINREIEHVDRKAKRKGMRCVIRLNGTSDLAWERMPIRNSLNVFQLNPDVMFYDYTAIPNRLSYLKANPLSNYSLIFSAKENNWSDCVEAIRLGYNVATVFPKMPPSTYNGYRVINGDEHDFRFLDPSGCIVGLKAKGAARRDQTGFVKRDAFEVSMLDAKPKMNIWKRLIIRLVGKSYAT